MTRASMGKALRARWGKLDGNHKKLAVFVPCFLLVFTLATHPGLLHRSQPMAQGGLRPYHQAPGAMTMPAGTGRTSSLPASSAIVSPGSLAGKFEGRGKVGTGICTMQLELMQESAEAFTAYPALQCTPLPSYFITGKAESNPAAYLDMLTKASPSTAILNGGWKNGALVFHVKKLTGNDAGCPMTSFTATPFGSAELTAQWTTDKCGKGALLLTKVRQ